MPKTKCFTFIETEKSGMMKHNPNIIITWHYRLCILYIVQIFTLNFTKMLLITFTRTYGQTRKEINRVWSILKTIVTGKGCSTDHAVKGGDIKFTFRVMSRGTKAIECRKIYLLTPAGKIYPSSVSIWVALSLFSSHQLFSSTQVVKFKPFIVTYGEISYKCASLIPQLCEGEKNPVHFTLIRWHIEPLEACCLPYPSFLYFNIIFSTLLQVFFWYTMWLCYF